MSNRKIEIFKDIKKKYSFKDIYELEMFKDIYSYTYDIYIEKLEQENKMMRECLEIIKEDKVTPWLTVETSSAKKAKECLAKLTEGGK